MRGDAKRTGTSRPRACGRFLRYVALVLLMSGVKMTESMNTNEKQMGWMLCVNVLRGNVANGPCGCFSFGRMSDY